MNGIVLDRISNFRGIGDCTMDFFSRQIKKVKIIILTILIATLTLRLIFQSEGILLLFSVLAFGGILLRLTFKEDAHFRYFQVLLSYLFFSYSTFQLDLSFPYFVSFLYPLMLVYVFLLPNPFVVNLFTAASAILLIKYNIVEGFEFVEGKGIGFVINVAIFSGLVYLIKQLKQKNEDLQKEKNITKKMISLLPEPVTIITMDEFLYINPEGIKLLGLETETDVIGKSPLEFLHPNHHDLYIERIDSILASKEIARHNEFKLIRADGEIIDIELSSVPTIYEKKPALITIINDVTVKNRATNELMLNSEKLRMVGQMAAGIAHELKNPLTSVKGFIQLLRSNQVGKDLEYVDIVATELERLNMIVNEFLFLSKPQEMKFKNVNVISLMISVLKLLSPQAVMQNVQMKTNFDLDVPLIHADENQIKQVLVNLFKNAIEAMPRGGQIRVFIRNSNSGVVISVTDEGSGIPPEQIKKIAEPFYTTKEKGTGLGLMVCYKIIENHHGKISFRSQVDEGTEVMIELPAAAELGKTS
jgi:two-component system sporulation sensor kinase A